MSNLNCITNYSFHQVICNQYGLWFVSNLPSSVYIFIYMGCTECSATEIVWPNKRKDRIICTEQWRDPINRGAHLCSKRVCSVEVFKTVRERRKNHYKRRQQKRLVSTASHVSDEKRNRCLMLVPVWWLKSRNGFKRFVNKLQNVMFSKHAQIACIQKALHELAAPGFKGKSALKHCYSTVAQ